MLAVYSAGRLILEVLAGLEDAVDQAATVTDAEALHVHITEIHDRVYQLLKRSARHVDFVKTRMQGDTP